MAHPRTTPHEEYPSWNPLKQVYVVGDPRPNDPVHNIIVWIDLPVCTKVSLHKHILAEHGDLEQAEVILIGNNGKILGSCKYKEIGTRSRLNFNVPIQCDPELLKKFLTLSSIKFRLLTAQGWAAFEGYMPLALYTDISTGGLNGMLVEFVSTVGRPSCPVDVFVSVQPTSSFIGSHESCGTGRNRSGPDGAVLTRLMSANHLREPLLIMKPCSVVDAQVQDKNFCHEDATGNSRPLDVTLLKDIKPEIVADLSVASSTTSKAGTAAIDSSGPSSAPYGSTSTQTSSHDVEFKRLLRVSRKRMTRGLKRL